MARNRRGLSVIDTIEAPTRVFVDSRVRLHNVLPRVATMNENSPICASATATEMEVLNGYRIRRTIANAASGLPMRMTSSMATISDGGDHSMAGSSSIPTDTKNNTANASRMGRASAAARTLNSVRPTTSPARNAPSAIETPNTSAAATAQTSGQRQDEVEVVHGRSCHESESVFE